MSLASIGRLTRCARANSDRYAIIRNFFHTRQYPHTTLLHRRVLAAVNTRAFHLSPTLNGNGARWKRRNQVVPPTEPPDLQSEDVHEPARPTTPPEQPPPPPIPPDDPLQTTTDSAPKEQPQETPSTPQAYNFNNYSRFFRQLAASLPHLHRPTRDDFLNVANGFWQRTSVRFKWFTIKSFRKFNSDDISAFVSMFLMSQTLWILVGTCVLHSLSAISVLTGLQNNILFCRFCYREWIGLATQVSSYHFNSSLTLYRSRGSRRE